MRAHWTPADITIAQSRLVYRQLQLWTPRRRARAYSSAAAYMRGNYWSKGA